MAKTMARIEAGVVVNIEWCSDDRPQSDTLVDLGDLPAGIGDTYQDGQFFRNGEPVLTEADELRNEMADMRNALSILEVTADGEVDEGS